MPGTVPTEAETEMLTGVISSMLGGCYCALLKVGISENAAQTLAGCLAAEANFTGYARAQCITWSSPFIDATGAAVSTTTNPQYTPTAAAGTGSIYGYFLVAPGNAAWYGMEIFGGGPVSTNQGVTLEVDVTYSLITRF